MSEKLDDKSIVARIRQLRQEHAGKRGKAIFAKALGLSPSTYNYYEKDRLPPINVLWSICRTTGADLQWLLTGEKAVSVGNDAIPDPLHQKIVQCLRHDPNAAVVLQSFLDLLLRKSTMEKEVSPEAVPDETSPRHWLPILGRTAAGFIQFWQDEGDKLPGITELSELIDRHKQSSHRRLPAGRISHDAAQLPLPAIADSAASLIQLTEVNEEGICEFIDCYVIADRYPGSFGLRVDGDSMAPRLCEGDIVILHPDMPARDGMTAVVKLRDQIGTSCKIVRFDGDRVHLIASSERYDTKIYPQEQISWALAVLWRIRLS